METGQRQRTKSPAPDLEECVIQQRCDNRTLVYSQSWSYGAVRKDQRGREMILQ